MTTTATTRQPDESASAQKLSPACKVCAVALWRFVRRLGKRRPAEIGSHVSALRYCQWGCASFSGTVIRADDRVTLIRPDKRWTALPVDVEVWTHDVTPSPDTVGSRGHGEDNAPNPPKT